MTLAKILALRSEAAAAGDNATYDDCCVLERAGAGDTGDQWSAAHAQRTAPDAYDRIWDVLADARAND